MGKYGVEIGTHTLYAMVMIGLAVLGLQVCLFFAEDEGRINKHPVEVTILQDGADQYSVEIRNVSKKTISIKTTYIDDREDTSGIKTYIMGSSGYDCPVDKIREDMVCECETMSKHPGGRWNDTHHIAHPNYLRE